MKEMLSTSRVFLAVLFIGLFAMAARDITDPDLWWHLRTGQYIAEHKSVPRTDPFSFTRAGQPWVAHEWLTEVFLYQAHRIAGWGGLIVIFGGILCAAFFLLYLRCGRAPYVAGISTLFAAWATAPVWGVRPQVLSLLLTSLWLLLLERSENNSKLLWWTLPLTLLWVNLHAGFALGLALSALFLVGEWLEQRFRPSSLGDARHFKISALVLALDFLVVPLNPNGQRLFSYPIETLRSATMQKYIEEWASPNFHRAEYWPFLFLLLGLLAACSWSQRAVRPRDMLVLLVGLYAGLCSMRMVPLFVLIAVPIVSQRIGNWPRHTANRSDSRVPVRQLVNATISLAMVSFAGFHTARVIQRQFQVEKEHFPARAVDFLQAHPPTSPLFNSYNWGGYLIWRLSPSTRVFIDGRADLYDKQLLDQFADTYQFTDNWNQILRQWSIGTVLVPRDSPLATGLLSRPGWTMFYQDEQAVVITEASRAHPADLGLPASSPENRNANRRLFRLADIPSTVQENTTYTASCRVLCVGIISPRHVNTLGTSVP